MEVNLTSKGMLWTGTGISALCILIMILDGIFKVVKAIPSMEGTIQLGVPASQVQGIGIVLLVCTAFYIIPRTAILGAILLTGYLGGAISIMARIETPYWFPVTIGVLVWAGLYLCDDKLRSLIPLKNK
jgi:hypothetical protein